MDAATLRIDPAPLRTHPIRLLFRLLISALALFLAAWIVPGVEVNGFWGALIAALLIAVINAVVPPLLAALPIPWTLVITLLLLSLIHI